MGLEHQIQRMEAVEKSSTAAAVQSEASPELSLLEELHDEPEVSNSSLPPHLLVVADDEPSKNTELEEASGIWPTTTGPDRLNSISSPKVEDSYDLRMDEIREHILESLQQTMGVDGQRDTSRPDTDSKLEMVAKKEYGPLGQAMYQGDLEFVMPPAVNERALANQMDLLSDLLMALNKVPGASVLEKGGSEKGGTYLVVRAERPICLDELLNNEMRWEEEEQNDESDRAQVFPWGPRSGDGHRVVQRRRLVLTP